MSREKKDARVQRSLFSFSAYFVFFLLMCFVVTCNFLLFFAGTDVPVEMVKKNAGRTFGNIIFLSLLFGTIDGIRRKLTIEKPIRRILEATHRITQGDLDARVEPMHTMKGMNEFDAIIEDFNVMAQELSGIETLRTDFIANVSHELKTPLAVIQNYATMLQDPVLPAEKQVEYAKAVAAASRRLSDLITNILKLNKLENQQIFPEKRQYDLSEQLCECLLGFEDIWEKKELEIETDIEEDTGIEADPELLSLVWNNLFSNAMKFTQSGGRVRVSLKKEDGRAVVSVEDTGCGMSAEVGQHIFEKFYQGDSSHASQGNGLGLALVKRVVDITGGEIEVSSTPGIGSIFTVKLELAAGETKRLGG